MTYRDGYGIPLPEGPEGYPRRPSPPPIRRSRLCRHWRSGITLSASGAAIAGGGFALATGAAGWGAAGVVLAAGVVTTWLSAPAGGVGLSLACWSVLLLLFITLGQADMLAGLVVWALLCLGLLVGVGRAWREGP